MANLVLGTRLEKWRQYFFSLLFHFSRGQNLEYLSSVFLCSETKRKRLLRRLRKQEQRRLSYRKLLVSISCWKFRLEKSNGSYHTRRFRSQKIWTVDAVDFPLIFSVCSADLLFFLVCLSPVGVLPGTRLNEDVPL